MGKLKLSAFNAQKIDAKASETILGGTGGRSIMTIKEEPYSVLIPNGSGWTRVSGVYRSRDQTATY